MYGSIIHDKVIENNEKETGITIHYVSEHYDSGQIIFQKKIIISDFDTAQTIEEKIHKLEYEYYPKIIESSYIKQMSRLIKIYTDGSSIGNPGPGGYGIVMLVDNEDYKKEFSQGFNLTTNNRMELLAVIVALEKIKIKNSKVKVYTDSKYVSDAVEKGWLFNWVKKDFKNKKNPDLWRRFLDIYNEHEVKFQWVKGHNNDFYNERCDFLANLAAKNSNLIEDKGYTTNLN